MINIRKWLGLDFYDSPLDQFLDAYDQTHTQLSCSQNKEKTKYAAIFKKRDHLNKDNEINLTKTKKSFPLWDKF